MLSNNQCYSNSLLYINTEALVLLLCEVLPLTLSKFIFVFWRKEFHKKTRKGVMDDAINNPILSVMVQAVISPEELIHVYNTENIFLEHLSVLIVRNHSNF